MARGRERGPSRGGGNLRCEEFPQSGNRKFTEGGTLDPSPGYLWVEGLDT